MKALSPATIRFYRTFIEELLKWLGNQQLDSVAIDDWKRYLFREREPRPGQTKKPGEHQNRPTSINARLRAVKAFSNWAVRSGFLKKSPMEGVAFLREPPTLPRMITPAEVQKLVNEARKAPLTAYRDTAILWLLYDDALRPGELVNLEVEDIDWASNSILVNGKTGERKLVFQPGTRKALQVHLRHRVAPPGASALFTTIHGDPLSVNALRLILNRLGKKAGIHTFAYAFRHGSATQHLNDGADIMTLKAFLGHRSVTTTQRYLHSTTADIARMQKKSSPANRLK